MGAKDCIIPFIPSFSSSLFLSLRISVGGGDYLQLTERGMLGIYGKSNAIGRIQSRVSHYQTTWKVSREQTF